MNFLPPPRYLPPDHFAPTKIINELKVELEAAKQRELELLAVIERLADDWDDLLEDMEMHGMHKFEPYIKSKANFRRMAEERRKK